MVLVEKLTMTPHILSLKQSSLDANVSTSTTLRAQNLSYVLALW